MKSAQILTLALACTFVLGGCGPTPSGNPSSPAAASQSQEASASQTPGDSSDAFSSSLPLDSYVDASSLSISGTEIPQEVTCDDRTLVLEDTIENPLENTVYQFYRTAVEAEFDQRMGLVGDYEPFSISAGSNEALFADGIYMEEYVIHSLSLMTAEELARVSDSSAADILEILRGCGLQSYGIVAADLSWKHNQAALAAGPQLEDGRYLRYYLLGTTPGSQDFKIYNVYWEGFLLS